MPQIRRKTKTTRAKVSKSRAKVSRGAAANARARALPKEPIPKSKPIEETVGELKRQQRAERRERRERKQAETVVKDHVQTCQGCGRWIQPGQRCLLLFTGALLPSGFWDATFLKPVEVFHGWDCVKLRKE